MILDFLFPLPYKSLHKDKSTVVFFSDGSIARIFRTDDDKLRVNINGEEIPLIVKEAFIAAEDRYFYFHFGINPVSVLKAGFSNLKNRRIVSGASTITMQTARMSEPKPRTFLNKIKECFRAIQIELRYSKDEILAMYLNLLPFGSNLEGIETASLLYFSKTTENLNPGEIAILTTIPRSPNLHNPVTGSPEHIRYARDRALRLMYYRHVINKELYEIALRTPLPESADRVPFHIPHITDYLYYKKKERGKVYTTIDKDIQIFLERTIANYMSNLKKTGINNITAVIACNNTSSVMAAVGSEDYFEENTGQIIGFDAKRSPGSLLKPFLYANAIEEGLITPLTLLEDVPVYYSDYEPTNYGGIFSGISNAKDALCNSLNIPAVNLLDMTGTDRFLTLLKSLGFSIPGTHEEYGLSIILGSAEITLLEAIRAFMCFNNGGLLNELLFTAVTSESQNPQRLNRRIYKEGTTYIISQMLKDHSYSSLDDHLLYGISWKTGTSFRYRDAWVVGYNPYFTVGIWIGNFAGPVPSLNTGHNTASPLMFMIFNHLMRNRPILWYEKPDEIMEIDVCYLSGMLPTEHCQHTKKTLVLGTKVPMDRCIYHRSFPVDSEGYVICDTSVPVDKYQIYIDFPPAVRSWLQINKTLAFSIPKYRKECRTHSISPIAILFPQSNKIFHLNDETDIIPLKLAPNPYTEHIYLFIDDRYIRRYSNTTQINISPEKGRRKIYLVDDFGQPSNTINIDIR